MWTTTNAEDYQDYRIIVDSSIRWHHIHALYEVACFAYRDIKYGAVNNCYEMAKKYG